MTPEIMTALLGLVTLVGAAFGYWRYFEGRIASARDKADKVSDDLAGFKLRVAEHYVSKQGLRETTEQILASISGVKDAVDNMTLRVDRIVENQVKPRTTRGV